MSIVCNRKKTRRILLGNLPIGGGEPISIQSMLKIPPSNLKEANRRIERLVLLGADIVRVSIKYPEDVEAVGELVRRFDIPIIADIHFNHYLAINVIKKGIAGIRINPGNINDKKRIKEIVTCAKDYNPSLVFRVGVNSGSLLGNKSFEEDEVGLMVRMAKDTVSKLVDMGIENIKVSLKSSDVITTILANRRFSEISDFPLHIGVTATGISEMGIVKSSIGIGILLYGGIGDTFRVSLQGSEELEVLVGRWILESLGIKLREKMGLPNIVACPLCGRAKIDTYPIVRKVFDEVMKDPLRFSKVGEIAVMGCEVNGPGEARNADVGIACGKDFAIIFSKGREIKRVDIGKLWEEFMKILDGMISDEGGKDGTI